MTNKNLEIHPIANDAVIAIFFMRTLKIIAAMILITVGLVYYLSQEKTKDDILEKTYQIPKKSSKNTKSSKALFFEQVKQRNIGLITENGVTGMSLLSGTNGLAGTFIDYDNKGNQYYVSENGTNLEWNHAILPVPTLYNDRSYINLGDKTYLYHVPENSILGINVKNND